MTQLSGLADDLKSTEGEYIRLIENELAKFLLRAKNRREPVTPEFRARIRQSAVEIYAILNADFGENYNPHHGDQR